MVSCGKYRTQSHVFRLYSSSAAAINASKRSAARGRGADVLKHLVIVTLAARLAMAREYRADLRLALRVPNQK